MSESAPSGSQPHAQTGSPEPQRGLYAPAPLDSQTLLLGRKEVLIAHGGVTYRLQTTRQGKLILTK